MRRLTVTFAANSHEILIGSGLLPTLGAHAKKVCRAPKAMIITDENVAPLYLDVVRKSLESAAFSVSDVVLKPGEETKCLACLGSLYDALCANRLTRSDVIIALGGGVIGDLAGFAAATYLRGIPYIQVPTSLLAQVDSAVGGKVAIDLPQGKNLAGAFYQPCLVLVDPDTLQTLPDRIFFDGMGEAVKYGCIYDEALFALIEKNPSREALMRHISVIIETCLNLKRIAAQQDERDTGARMALNFGHTLGHAIEVASNYQGLRHGEAVCAGMVLITRLSEKRGLTEPGTAERLFRLLKSMSLPVSAPENLQLMSALTLDKKNLNGVLNCVLIRQIGESFIYPTDVSFFEEAQTWQI